jgi:hypothetical protein
MLTGMAWCRILEHTVDHLHNQFETVETDVK